MVDRVHRLSRSAGLTKMPEVGIYRSPEVNAFATGPSKRRSLVAVSSGLLEQMDDAAVEGVLAHEVAHITNGDMVTMTLLQGIVNTFVVFIAYRRLDSKPFCQRRSSADRSFYCNDYFSDCLFDTWQPGCVCVFTPS